MFSSEEIHTTMSSRPSSDFPGSVSMRTRGEAFASAL
jgi:hypothetical protein